jgi:hypothetical protein
MVLVNRFTITITSIAAYVIGNRAESARQKSAADPAADRGNDVALLHFDRALRGDRVAARRATDRAEEE